MDRSILREVLAMAMATAICVQSIDASAQEKKKVVYSTPAENSKYVQQHAIDVGDVPGHQVRVYEIQRTYPKDAPSFEGVRLKESWSRGYSNYIDSNGPSTIYTVYLLENGDKFFARNELMSQATSANPDGTRKSISTVSGTITGGTGKFIGIRGTSRTIVNANSAAGLNAQQTEIEYWMEK